MTDRRLLALLTAAAALLLWHLGAYGLWESTEARYAEIAAAMVRSGDWLTPRLNGIVHFDKPPLTYWATGLGLALFGIDEFGARVGLVAAALGTLVIVHRWVVDTDGEPSAAFAFAALLTSPLYFALARSVTTDVYLTAWVVLAVDAARRGTAPDGRRRWRLLAWAAVGLGFMTKGPVVLLWTALPALAWAAATHSWGRLRRLIDPVGIAIACAIALPWYIVMAARHPGLLSDWLGGQVAARMATPYDGERAPLWFFAPVLAWCAGPWIIAAFGEAIERIRRGGGLPYEVVWIAAPLIAFSLFPTKRINYLVPLVPAVAILAGRWWGGAAKRRGARPVLGAIGAATTTIGAGLWIAASRAELPAELLRVGAIAGPIWIAAGLVVLYAVIRASWGAAFTSLAAALAALYLVGYATLQHPAVESFFKISRPLAMAVIEHRIADAPVVAYGDWPRAFPFYLGERLITITGEGRRTTYERDETWRRFVFTDDAEFHARYTGSERTLFYVSRGTLEEIEARYGSPIVLAETRRHALITPP